MSTIIMSACWDLQGMTPAQKAVLVSLADQANDSGVCWPGIKTIERRTCLSERAVQEALRWLQTTGAVYRDYQPNKTTVYTVTPQNFDPAKAPSKRERNRGADGAPPADSAPPANGAPGAGGAPPPAGGAPLDPQQAHPTPAAGAPKSKGNRKGTIKEPFPPASQPGQQGVDSEKQAKEEAFKELCRETWNAYSAAYALRYKTEPVRNAKVNTAIAQFVKRIGKEAPDVAKWFVASAEEAFILKRFHDVGDLLASCEAYRTQWAVGATAQTQSGNLNKQEALERRNRRVGEAWASQGGEHAAA